MGEQASYLKAAFLVPANLFALVAAAVALVVTGDWTVGWVALGVEGLYLSTLMSAQAFRRVVRARGAQRDGLRRSAEQMQRLMEELSPSQRGHYVQLRELRNRILANYGQLPGGGVLAAASERQVDALLTAFLRLLVSLNGYRKYLTASEGRALESEHGALLAEVAVEENVKLREVKVRRADILKKRIERFTQAQDSREVVSHQLASIEDLLRLTHEQSISIRDPEALGQQLDVMGAELQATEETVREMEKFLDVTDELATPLSHGMLVR